MDYKPNMYASALAYNKSYNFFMILPKHESEAYWEEIEEGASTACDHLRDFRVSNKVAYYNRFDTSTFAKTMTEVLRQQPDGVIVVPSQLDITRKYTDIMHEQGIPFILLDSYMPDLRPLAFFGQDSFSSGFFAARMLMINSRRTVRRASAITCTTTTLTSPSMRSTCHLMRNVRATMLS